MKVPWRIGTAFSVICLSFTIVNAHSVSRNPLNYVSLVENTTIQTPSHRVHYQSHFDLLFNLHQNRQRIKLSLEPNHDVIAHDASVQYLGPDGRVVRTEPIDRQSHKVYKGDAWMEDHDGSWFPVGWARIMIKRDGIHPLFEGAFVVDRDHHHVQLRSNYMSTKHELDPAAEPSNDEYMVLFRDSDIARQSSIPHTELKRAEEFTTSCRSHELHFNSDPTQTVLKRNVGFWAAAPISSLFGKRQIDTTSGGNSGGVNLSTTIGNSAGCPSTRKVALIGVATDCSYSGSFNDSNSAHANVIQQISTASSLYEKSFNITLGLQNLTVSDASCPASPSTATPWNLGCSSNATITDRLNSFSQWRGTRNDSNAYWTLLTNCPTGAEVGLSWLGQLCQNSVTNGSGESVSSANVVAKTSTEWQVIAHETGHTFGAVHDCDASVCAQNDAVASQQCCPLSSTSCDAGSKYIMNPSTGEGITDFSACTIGNICSALGRNSVKSSCLSDNKGVSTITGQQCGNGIVEPGEDCDCGGEANCGNDACCDATTCKFKGSAVCDDSNEDCCKNCQFASSGTVCRASTNSCDPQETCSGTNASCPIDQTAPDGQACGNSTQKLQCASGQCTSRDQQCKTLMGSYTAKNDTYACNSEDCTLSCASPEFGFGVCYSMQQNFLDGTPCGGGGKCSNGQCNGSSTAKEIGSWINSNKTLVIGLCTAAGALILLSILGCCVRRCRRPRQQPRRTQPMVPSMRHQGWAGGPPPQGWAGGGGGGGGTVDEWGEGWWWWVSWGVEFKSSFGPGAGAGARAVGFRPAGGVGAA